MAQPASHNTKFPVFKKDPEHRHLAELRQRLRLRQILDSRKQSGKFWIKFKAIIFPFIYLVTMVAVNLSYPNLWAYFGGFALVGFFMVIIYLTVIHELAHDTIFSSKKLNRYLLYFFDIMGANSFIWKRRHRNMHHNYPNINNWDTDIEQSPLFKVAPDAQSSKAHKYQHYLIFFLYPLYLFNWLIIRDFKDFFGKDRTIKKKVSIPAVEYFKLFFFKGFYLMYMFMIPIFVLGIPWNHAVLGFFIMTIVASITALLVLLPPHANMENEFPVLSSKLESQNTWFEHQLRTTNDLSNSNWFISFFMGNFNCHVAHHLFPNMDYEDLKIATQVLADYSREKGMGYKVLTLKQALISHYQLIKKNALDTSFLEETM